MADHHHGDGDHHHHGHAHSESDGHQHDGHQHDGHQHDGHQHDGDQPRDCLERGAGQGGVLFLDCFSGIAGDMTIAALLDLGVPLEAVADEVAKLPLDGYELVTGHAHRSGIVATRFDVKVAANQPERTYGAIRTMLESAPLAEDVRQLAQAIFLKLGRAEASVHRMPLEDVHFHEVGAVDALVDIVGAAAAIRYLGARVIATPLPMGHGFVKARHGTLPLPAPATVSCLAGVPTYGVDLEAELVTPTGAAIVATVADQFVRWPAIAPTRCGFGAGTRELPDRPNLLRAVLGDAAPGASDATHVVLEANVDDITGELAGHAIEMLLSGGALDAWATPITMKNGRPAITVAAICALPHGDDVAAILLRETTTIGVRRTPVSRIELPRRIASVVTPFGTVDVKVSGGQAGHPHVKPEFAQCTARAAEHGGPVRVVLAAAIKAYDADVA